MQKKLVLFTLGLTLLSLIGTSCQTRKKMVYFQTTENDSLAKANSGFTPIFKTDDFLSIVISAEDPEAAKMYNFPVIITTPNQGYTMGNPAPFGYLIDARGNISLPILGTFRAAGKSRMQLEREIVEMLKDHLKSPTVQIQIQNFKVTVLGEVKIPGTFKIPNERVTVLEAIGLAGDLKMSGVRNNVLVIRDSSGVRSEYRLDLTKKDLFSSPAYYLQQNDLVYVEPNSAGRSEGTVWRTTGAIFISLTSLVVTTVALLAR